MILWGIAKNIYKEHIRELIKRNEKTSNFDESDLVEKEEYYNENFDKKIEAMKLELYELIESLNENVKKVIKLRFIEGLTIKSYLRTRRNAYIYS